MKTEFTVWDKKHEEEIVALSRIGGLVDMLKSYMETTKEAGYIPTIDQLIEDLLEQEVRDNPQD